MSKKLQCRLTNNSRGNKFFNVVQQKEQGYKVLFSGMCMTHGALMCSVDVESQGDCYVFPGDRPLNAGDTTNLENSACRIDTNRERMNYTYNMDGNWSVSPY